MGRPSILLFLAVASVGGWFLLQHFEIRGLDDLKRLRRDVAARSQQGVPVANRDQETIRIASFNLQTFDPVKAENLAVMEVLARIIREFDIVALQEVCGGRPDVLRKLLDRVNEEGRSYSLLAGPPVGRAANKQQFVFAYDEATVETDRSAAYTIDDPDDLLYQPSLVGWFRVRGPATDKAFTFTLVNVQTDPEDALYEIKPLSNAYFKVRDDGRGEDDLIMLGNFNLDNQQMGDLARIPGLLATIAGRPTNTRQTRQCDNLFFQLPATCEYAGRSGVYDFMREYNLTLQQALAVSDHLPVWAEFSIYEGGSSSAVIATQSAAAMR